MLISSKLKNGSPCFQIHKQGLQLLRKFRNKRLRIILNVTHQSDTLQNFNACFLNQTTGDDVMNNNSRNNMSQLRVSSHFEQLSQNRVLLFLNAYENSEMVHLLVLGYLVASVFFYHNEQQLGQKTNLSKMLVALKKLLGDTKVHQLQQQIKYKSGCSKKPYLMCLFQQANQNQQNYHDLFRQFYKYKSGNLLVNQSVDTLIDYFPQRSAINIGRYHQNQNNGEIIKKLGKEYRQNILGRQLFNFEITGSSLQNLCFELCQVFNSNVSSINLLKIYNKIINNQKTQVLDLSIQKYSGLVNQLVQGLPYEPVQLLESHGRISEYVLAECIADASNCMIFSQYVPIYCNLSSIMLKRLKEVQDTNRELLRNRALSCYQEIEDDQNLQNFLSSIDSSNSGEILLAIEQKIKSFMSYNIQQRTTFDLLSRLINKYLQIYGESITTILRIKQESQREQNEKINKLVMENKIYQLRMKELENQFIYLSSINNQYKEKLLNCNKLNDKSINGGKGDYHENGIIVLEMKKKIVQLEIQLTQKNQIIQNLSAVFDKFQVQFNRKYYKPKFNKDVQNLLTEITSKMNQMHSLFTELKRTEQCYKDIQVKFESKKKQFNQERFNQKQEVIEIKEKLYEVFKQKNLLQEIVQEAKQSIRVLKSVEKEDKEIINQLQNGFSRLKCSLAEIEGQFEKFKKALELVVHYCVTGKSQKLRDFIKVLNQQQLKEILKPILKR